MAQLRLQTKNASETNYTPLSEALALASEKEDSGVGEADTTKPGALASA